MLDEIRTTRILRVKADCKWSTRLAPCQTLVIDWKRGKEQVLDPNWFNMAAKWSALTLKERIEKAEKLFERSQNLQKSIEGLSKLKRKILAEVKFLKSVSIIINQPTCTYNCSFRCMFVKNDSVVDSILDFLTRTSEERNVVLVVLECSVLKQFACFFFSAKH